MFARAPHGAQPPVPDISLWGAKLSDIAPIALPALFGLLGATAAGLRMFSAALRQSMLDNRTALQIVVNLVLGVVGGTTIGLIAQTVDISAMGAGFVIGYAAPGLFSRLDDLTAWIFLPRDHQDARRRTGLDLLQQPVNLTTHFAAGAVITIFLMFFCLVIARNRTYWKTCHHHCGMHPTQPASCQR